MVEACANGELDLLYCLGGNFLRTLPDPNYVTRALANVPMRVHQDIILSDQMFIEAKEEVILLPAKTRYEQDDGGIETTTERRIAFSPEIPRQVGEAQSGMENFARTGRGRLSGARAFARMRNRLGDARGDRARRAVLRRHPKPAQNRRRHPIRRPASVCRLEISDARRQGAFPSRPAPEHFESALAFSRSARVAANNSTRSFTTRRAPLPARSAMPFS